MGNKRYFLCEPDDYVTFPYNKKLTEVNIDDTGNFDYQSKYTLDADKHFTNHKVPKLSTCIDLIATKDEVSAECIKEIEYERNKLWAIVVTDNNMHYTCIFIGDISIRDMATGAKMCRFEEPVMRLRTKAKIENDELVPI